MKKHIWSWKSPWKDLEFCHRKSVGTLGPAMCLVEYCMPVPLTYHHRQTVQQCAWWSIACQCRWRITIIKRSSNVLGGSSSSEKSQAPKGVRPCRDFRCLPLCVEYQGSHLIPSFYLLSCYSAYCPVAPSIFSCFLLLVHSPDYFPEMSLKLFHEKSSFLFGPCFLGF